MLVLSRQRDERIVITTPLGRVVVTVVDIRGDKTRIGVDAPTEWPVNRAEVQSVVDAAAAGKVTIASEAIRAHQAARLAGRAK